MNNTQIRRIVCVCVDMCVMVDVMMKYIKFQTDKEFIPYILQPKMPLNIKCRK